MSRVGKSPIKVPAGVKINVNGQVIVVEGPKGKLSFNLSERVTLGKEGDVITLTRPSDSKTDKALHGTSRAILNNMVTGVTKGFQKELEIRGVGYRGEQKGKSVSLLLGYSHPILFEPPAGVYRQDGRQREGGRGRHRSPGGRPGRGDHPRLQTPGTLQGQGRSLHG